MRNFVLLIISAFFVTFAYASPSFACGGCPGENPQPTFADWAFVTGIVVTFIGMIVLSIVFLVSFP